MRFETYLNLNCLLQTFFWTLHTDKSRGRSFLASLELDNSSAKTEESDSSQSHIQSDTSPGRAGWRLSASSDTLTDAHQAMPSNTPR